MLRAAPAGWTVRGATFALWLLAAGSAAYWGLRLAAPAASLRAPVVSGATPPAADPQAIAALLGGAAAAAPAPGAGIAAAPLAPLASRFKLVGIAAAPSGAGAAVISVDGRPARPYRVGTAVDEGLLLLAVRGREALLGPAGGPPAVTLQLPEVPK